MELGSKIKALRLRAGMTQDMLAEELGVSFQTISKWENGVCAPDIMMLPKLSVYFGVTIDEIFDLTKIFDVERLHFVATDGYTCHMKETVDKMDNETYDLYLRYHFKTCERQDLVGISHHTLDVLRKE